MPNLSQVTNIQNLHCDFVIDSLVDGSKSDLINSFSTLHWCSDHHTVSMRWNHSSVTYNPVNKVSISSIADITDARCRIINLIEADPAFSLIMKRVAYRIIYM